MNKLEDAPPSTPVSEPQKPAEKKPLDPLIAKTAEALLGHLPDPNFDPQTLPQLADDLHKKAAVAELRLERLGR